MTLPQNDLVTFLRARLDDDERAAQETAGEYGARWHVLPGIGSVQSDKGADITDDPYVPVAHIARHDPARVLADIEAKLAIVDLHRPVTKRSTGSSGGTVEDCSLCDHFPAQYPCQTLRLLALPFADHPEYDEAWRP